MSLVSFAASNHPQQTAKRGALDPIDDRATPPEYFAVLHERFGFTLDAAASAQNAKLPRFFDYASDGLSQSWACERVFVNPPFSDLGAWVTKAATEAKHAELIVMLVPANRTEQGWWHTHVEPFRDRAGSRLRTEFVKKRLRFIKAGAESVEMNNRPPFGVCLLIWDEQR